MRETAPLLNDIKYYGQQNPYFAGNFGMPNCTTYVFGRFWEFTNEYPKYPLTNGYDATTIFYHCQNDSNSCYKNCIGKDPKIGAIACFSTVKNDNPTVKKSVGHVAFVEKVLENGDIYTSNSAWKSTNFYMKTYYKKDNYSFKDSKNRTYYLQGFIYPEETKKEKYMKVQAHFQNLGWVNVNNRQIFHKDLRLEALKIDASFEIEASCHIEILGWKNFGKINKNSVLGSTEKGYRLECVRFRGDFEYRVFLHDTGWTCWTKADGFCTLGSVNQKLSIEGFEYRIIN